VRAQILRHQRIAIGAGRTADDAMVVIAGIDGGVILRPRIGHRAFDGKHTAVVACDDQVERLGGFRLGHAVEVLQLIKSVIDE
jgi:hypothetical protein